MSECCLCRDLFRQVTYRACCARAVCRQCLAESPSCLDCNTRPSKAVTLTQLQLEISLLRDIAQEQVQFYTQHLGCIKTDRYRTDSPSHQELVQQYQLAGQADAKAISLQLELLLDLENRLVTNQPNKTVLIPSQVLVRNKDCINEQIFDSGGILRAKDVTQQEFMESHRIPHSWSGKTMPRPGNYLRKVSFFLQQKLVDISGLAGCRLTSLVLAGTSVRDISVIANMPLTNLDLSFTQVVNLTVLATLPTLLELNLGNLAINDINSLVVSKPPLLSLDLYKSKIVDLSALRVLNQLTYLNLSGTRITSIAVLAELTTLINLNLSNTQIYDISPLANSRSLENLNLRLSQVSDITALAGTKLKCLDLCQTGVTDWSMVENTPGIKIVR